MAKALVLGGATGLLGQPLTQALKARSWEVSTLGRNDGDLLDINFLQDTIADAQADVIFNTVAYTAVDDAEEHPEDARQLNRCLPDALAKILRATGKGLLVQFSTDFIFSGSGDTPKKENDTPRPASVYARSKLEGEKTVLAALPERSCIIRTAWLFGPGRKNFVDTILAACRQRDSISVVHDQIGSPTYTVDLAQWSVTLAEKQATGIWHAVNSGQASWCELACEAVSLAGDSCRVIPIDSSNWPQKAKRPSFSVLNNSKLGSFLGKNPRPWPQALRDYIFKDYLPARNTKAKIR